MNNRLWIRNAESLLLCLGFSLVYVWTFALDALAPTAPWAFGDPSVPSKLTSVVAAVACALLWKQLSDAPGRTGASVIVVACGAAHVLLAFGDYEWTGEGALWTTSLLRSSTVIVLTALWSGFFGRLPLFQAVVVIALSFASVTLADWALALLPAESIFGIAMLVPLLSVVCLRCAIGRLDADGRLFAFPSQTAGHIERALSRKSEPVAAQGTRVAAFPWQLLVLAVAYSIAIGITRSQASLDISVVSFGIAGIIILAIALGAGSRTGIHSIMGTSLPIMLAGLLVATLAGSASSLLAQMSTNVAMAMLTAFTLIVASDRAYRFGLSSVFLASVFRAAIVAATLLGTLLAHHLPAASDNPTSAIPLYVAVLALVAVATTVWFRGSAEPSPILDAVGAGAASGPSSPVAPEIGSDGDLVKDIASFRALVAARCSRIAEEGGLSPREREVLLCLARGMSIPRIESELVISNSTAKTHVRHVYRKLGIHSRDELRMLLDVE